MGFLKILLVYLAIVSVISFFSVISDKKSAEKGKRRIPEAVLFLFAGMGGSAAMYLTMCFVRHKTQKNSFVFGIPLIFFLQAVMMFYVFKYFGIDIII